MTVVLREVEIDDPEEVAECLELFQKEKYGELVEYPAEKYKDRLDESIRILVKRKGNSEVR